MIKRKYRSVSISGMRFKRLPFKSYYEPKAVSLKNIIKERLKMLYNRYGTQLVFDGMAEGIDLLVALAITELKSDGYDKFKIISCLPSERGLQTKYFSNESLELYDKIIKCADKIIHTDNIEGYSGSTITDDLLLRNKFMLDMSETSLVVFDFGQRGGTRHFYNNAVNDRRDFTIVDITDSDTLECHSEGDRRFSALYANINLWGHKKSIEDWYQGFKVTKFKNNNNKGIKPESFVINGMKFGVEYVDDIYDMLWYVYLSRNPLKLMDAMQYTEYHDKFDNNSTVSQATSISRILNNEVDVVERISKLMKLTDIKL
jgi:uncharacterized phage-like protein YoqJ